jgi:hypothetical protein
VVLVDAMAFTVPEAQQQLGFGITLISGLPQQCKFLFSLFGCHVIVFTRICHRITHFVISLKAMYYSSSLMSAKARRTSSRRWR